MTHVSVTLVIAEKKSVAVDVSKALEGTFKSNEELPRRPRHRHHVGRRPPRRAGRAGALRRQVQALEDGRPAHPPEPLRRRAARRGQVGQGAAGRDRQADEARRHRADRERLRRRARGRADLRLRAGRRRQEGRPGAARVVLVDDEGRDPPGVRPPAAGQRARAARGRGALALRGRLARGHERDARGDDPRPRRLRQHRGLARPRADADARDPRAAREGDPGLRADAVLARRRDVPARRQDRLSRPPRARHRDAHPHRRGRRRDRRAGARRRGPHHLALEAHPALAAAAAVRPHRAPARGGLVARLHRPPHALGRPGLLREGRAHVPAYVEPLPLERHDPRAQGDRRPRRQALEGVREGRRLRAGPARAAARPHRQQREGHGPPRDHPDERAAGRHRALARRAAHLRHGRPALPRRVPPAGRVREHDRADRGRRRELPLARQGHARGRLARRLRRGAARRAEGRRASRSTRTRARIRSCRRSRRARRCAAPRSPPTRARRSRRRATARPRCWPPWRAPASSSRTTSCARP